MDNKLVTSVLVIIIAIFIGVFVTVKQTNDPILQRLVQQQAEVLELQKKLDRQLSAGDPASGQAGQGIEGRLTALDRKIDGLTFAMKNFLTAGGGADGQAGQRPQRPSEDLTTVHKIDIGNSPIKGNKDAPITIVEFTDFQCPFCARFHPVVEDVLKAYPDKVKLVLKNFPLSFHKQARPAAKAALAAKEQGKYWEMAQKLLDNGKALSEEKIQELAKETGLDMEKFNKDYKERDAEWEKMIQEDMALGQKVGVRGTPSFYLNGRKTLARDLATYKTQIDAILNAKK